MSSNSTSTSKIMIIGDSRVVGMARQGNPVDTSVNGVHYFAEVGQGSKWLKANKQQISTRAQSQNDIVISMGVNDISNVGAYKKWLTEMLPIWRAQGKNVYFTSVDPVGTAYHYGTRLNSTQMNAKIDTFNRQMQAFCIANRIPYIDTAKHVNVNHLTSQMNPDGLHYQARAAQSIRDFIIHEVNEYVEHNGYPRVNAQNTQTNRTNAPRESSGATNPVPVQSTGSASANEADEQTNFGTGDDNLETILKLVPGYLSVFLCKRGLLDSRGKTDDRELANLYTAQQMAEFYTKAEETQKQLIRQFAAAQFQIIQSARARNGSDGENPIPPAYDSDYHIITNIAGVKAMPNTIETQTNSSGSSTNSEGTQTQAQEDQAVLDALADLIDNANGNAERPVKESQNDQQYFNALLTQAIELAKKKGENYETFIQSFLKETAKLSYIPDQVQDAQLSELHGLLPREAQEQNLQLLRDAQHNKYQDNFNILNNTVFL